MEFHFSVNQHASVVLVWYYEVDTAKFCLFVKLWEQNFSFKNVKETLFIISYIEIWKNIKIKTFKHQKLQIWTTRPPMLSCICCIICHVFTFFVFVLLYFHVTSCLAMQYYGLSCLILFCALLLSLGILKDNMNLAKKKMASMPLRTENPVKRPIVPPMRPRAASMVIFTSRSTWNAGKNTERKQIHHRDLKLPTWSMTIGHLECASPRHRLHWQRRFEPLSMDDVWWSQLRIDDFSTFLTILQYILRLGNIGSNLRFLAKELLYSEYWLVMASSLSWSSKSSGFL